MKPFEVIDAEQRSEAWFRARAGRVTASRAGDMLAKTKSGYSTSRKNLLPQLVAERLTGLPQVDGYQSPAMLRGIELEPKAFAAYESTTGQMADKAGFLRHLELTIGAAPDGVIGDFDGILELKVANPATQLCYHTGKTLPTGYRPQMARQLLVSGASYCDFMSYGPSFPEALQVFLVGGCRAE